MRQFRQLVFFKSYFHNFFNQQNERVKEKIDYVLFLVTHVERVPEKFLKQLEGGKGLYEIRVRVGTNIYRIFCCFDEARIIVLLNAFQKKAQKTPKNELKIAIKLMKEYFEQTSSNGN